LNYKPKERLPVTEWMKAQGRFKHLLVPEHEALVAEIQREIDDNWDKLLILCGEK